MAGERRSTLKIDVGSFIYLDMLTVWNRSQLPDMKSTCSTKWRLLLKSGGMPEIRIFEVKFNASEKRPRDTL